MEPDQQSILTAEKDNNESDNEKHTQQNDSKSESMACDESSKNVKIENLPANIENIKNILNDSSEKEEKEDIVEKKNEIKQSEEAKECDSVSSLTENKNSSKSNDNEDSADKKSELVGSQCTAKNSDETNGNNDNSDETKESLETTVKADDSYISEESKPVDIVVENNNNESRNIDTIEDVVEHKNLLPSPTSQLTPETSNAKSLPSSNTGEDGEFKIDSSSLLDRIILHTLKNTVVDNSRLNAAKNKYIMNNGNVNSSCNTNNNSNSSNGSDSNPSSKSVEKLIEEFKGSCKSNTVNNTPNMSVKEQQQIKSDNSEVTNGADRNLCSIKNDVETNTTTVNAVVINHATDKIVNSSTLSKTLKLTENEALDFRDSSSASKGAEEILAPTMLDLSVKRDEREKSVPPIKRSHAPYVGLPDFSKQIFTAPSISRTTNTLTNQGAKQQQQNMLQQQSSSPISVPKVRNPDFTSMARAPELQMRHPDFSKGFAKSESPSPVNVPITPSNFPEIARKNNYISDLQLKPPINTASSSSSSMTPSTSSSYKIDYRPPVMVQQQTTQSPYHNIKKENVNASGSYAQQQQQSMVEEPMAHVIHKNQFHPKLTKDSMINYSSNWSDHHRNERLLGGSSQYEIPHTDKKLSASVQNPSFHPNEDLRKLHPAHYPYAYHPKERECSQQNEFSLKQKEQQLRQEGTIITIKNDLSSKSPTREITERRSADLFRDYKLKQPKESPDIMRRSMNEQSQPQHPPPLIYHQQYPDFPPNYPRPQKFESESVKSNTNSPIPNMTQSSVVSNEYNQPIVRQYQNPSPVHRQEKSPMNPPQNWPAPPSTQQQQSPRHAVSPAAPASSLSSPSPTHYNHHGVSKISPSQSPIANYQHYPPKNQPQVAFKYPEHSNIPMSDGKNLRHSQSSGPSQSHNYYHQKFPDFARKFDNNYLPPEPYNAGKYPSKFTQIDSKPATNESFQHTLPIRHDLEIRTIREQPSDIRNIHQYRQQHHQQPSTSYYPQPQDKSFSRIPPSSNQIQERSHMVREGISHFSRNHNETPRVPPDLKIEKRIDDNDQRVYSPILTRRVESDQELSIIPKVKSEPPSTPIPREMPSNSSIIKSTKTIFGEVKRESPLDLSVKTVKTKADSTGCDQDFQSRYRKENKMSLKMEFTPNFSGLAKTECRQQARLGPQDIESERNLQTIPMRCSKETEMHRGNSFSTKVHQPQIVPSSSSGRNNFYDQKPMISELDRPHAPVPVVTNYYNDRQNPIVNHKTNSGYEINRHVISPAAQGVHSSEIHRSYENHRNENNFPQIDSHRNVPLAQAINIPYPVINKAPSSIEQQKIPSQSSINPKDPLYLERERDRKYVEDILYGRNRRETQYGPEIRQYHVNPSPPRKRHLEMSQQQQQHQQQIYDSMPPKQSRIEEPPLTKMFTNNPPTHINHNQQPPCVYNEARSTVNTPPLLIRHENYDKGLPVQAKQYPLPRKDVIKSADMMSYSSSSSKNAASTTSYYPNPKAEMIHRSDPMNRHKYYGKDSERKYQPQHHIPQSNNQNFHQRPDDTKFPVMHTRLTHPVQEIGSNIEKQLTPGPLSYENNNLGEHRENTKRHMINGNMMMSSSSLSGSNGNIARGADLSTIQKLKSNLEFKEMQKLKIQSAESELQLQKSTHTPQLTKLDLSPRQFRTKGELKGFIPLPISAATTTTEIIVDSNKKEIDSPKATSAFDLLDWGSACNDFVQQLQTGKKRIKKRRSQIKSDEKVMTRIPGNTVNDLSEIPKEILQSINRDERSSSSDEDKPLLQLKNSISQSSLTESIPEKLSRNFREKQRLELEQKMAARLGRPSSSESETDTRKNFTIVKRVRRLRKRATLGIKKTDDERTAEEEEEGETDVATLKTPSKLDDLTSSDEDNKNKSDKKLASDDKCVKNIKKLSSSAMSVEVNDVQNSKKDESSSESSNSENELETTEVKLNKLSSAKNVKKLKDLGDGESNIKNLLEEGETMTRSKRRLEIEKKLSNSKILRNEKVVQNVSPDKKAKQQQADQSILNKKSSLKRKDSCKSEDSKRKIPESESEKDMKSAKKKTRKSSQIENNSSSEESEAEEEEESRTERLRPRKSKTDSDATIKGTKENPKKIKSEKNEDKTSKTPDYKEGRRSLPAFHPFRDDKTSKFTPGWEAETFNFKRTLKVPIGLITIYRPQPHGISHSLPDLDPQTSDTSEIFSEFVKSKDKEGTKDAKPETSKNTSKNKQHLQNTKKSNSIIDLLHERVVQSKKKIKSKKATNINNSAKDVSNNDELLPTPQKESEKVFGFKKNIFEPFVITSRTRTENNALRKKEVLKEVFGADDERPRSAPPSSKISVQQDANEEGNRRHIEQNRMEKKTNFDEKYLEYLEKMNVNFPERKRIKLDTSKTDLSIKEEVDEDFDDNETIVAGGERDLTTPTLKGKVKKNRPRRCKGSSGFDYIRKKKKPAQNASENPLSAGNIIKKRLAAMENLETKDEHDISKEIKGWVLNKSVGESILHKAARLDYVDVVAYCLDRMNMSPDPKDNAGYTPLHEACSRGHLEIARLLLQYGANHSESALSGIRPLHEAIENGHIEIVRLLLSFGADPCLATYSGQMPISMAEDQEMEDFLNSYLIDIGHKEGIKTSWPIEAAYKIEDPDEIGYDIFSNVPIVKTDLGSVSSVLSTSMTSLITATTQMSDNETVISETATPLSNKISTTPIMKAPAQESIKYQHKMKKYDTNSNNLLLMPEVTSVENNKLNNLATTNSKKTKNCSVLLNNIDSTMKKIKKLPPISQLDAHIKSNEPIQKLDVQNQKDDYDDMIIDENLESDCEFLEVEESEAPLPPLYLLRDEGTDKWVLLTDLCNLLKVKSKEAVLKQICPSSPPTAANKSELIRELKMSDFLEKAICLQLFCAGEKINVRASKVSLVRYNESVKNLLGVQTIRMNM